LSGTEEYVAAVVYHVIWTLVDQPVFALQFHRFAFEAFLHVRGDGGAEQGKQANFDFYH
jgi:hypothetical protein